MSDQTIPLHEAKRREKDGGGAGDGSDGAVLLEPGKLPEIVDECVKAASGDGDLYQRGGFIVHQVLTPVPAADGRKTLSPRLLPITVPFLVERLTRRRMFKKYDARKNDWVVCNCPKGIAEAVLARGQWPEISLLSRIVNAPLLRPDGSILIEPGYDATTCLFLNFEDQIDIPNRPTRAQAQEALQLLKALLQEFAFASSADLSVALAAILTAIERPCLPTSPLFGVKSPSPGSGKSYLVDIISMIATGQLAAVIAPGKSEEETEKRLNAAALEGDPLISLDNCERPLRSAFLCQLITQEHVKIRVLGLSTNVTVPSNAAIFATGNNLTLAGDLTRRGLTCSLDPRRERPELRTFEANPLSMARGARGLYIGAGLTIMRAHAISDWRCATPAIASFSEWCSVVRDPLLWLGEHDPCETMARVREEDPDRAALAAVVNHWEQAFAETRVSVAKIVERATDRDRGGEGKFLFPEFRDALLQIAGEGGSVNTRRLGWWLRAHENRIVDGRRIVHDGDRGNASLWRLELLESEPP